MEEHDNIKPSNAKITLILLAIIIFQIVNQTRSTLYLWFARTLIHCPDTVVTVTRNKTNILVTTPKLSNMDKAWSGSFYCSNRDYVAGWAQYIITFATTVNTLCAITFVPMLGSLSDRLGRRFLLIISQIGHVIFLLCIGFAAVLNWYSDNAFTIVLVVAGQGILGATSVFSLGITNMIIDIQMKKVMKKSRALSDAHASKKINAEEEEQLKQDAEDGIGKYIGRFQGIKAFGSAIGAGIGFYYTTKNLESYASIWFSLSFLIFINLILTCFSPETLSKTRRRSSLRDKENLTPIIPIQQGENELLNHDNNNDDDDDNNRNNETRHRNINNRDRRTSLQRRCTGREGSACAAWPLIWGNGTMRTIALFIFLFITGVSCIAITQVFMTTQFEWTSTVTTLAGMSSGVIGVISLSFAGRIIKYLGPLKALITAATLAAIGLGLMATAPLGWFFFMIGLYVLMTSAFGSVAYIQFIAARVSPSSMGAIQGGLSIFAMLGFIIGSIVFTALNIALKKEHRWLCFLFGSCISGASCALVYFLLVYKKEKQQERSIASQIEQEEIIDENRKDNNSDSISTSSFGVELRETKE